MSTFHLRKRNLARCLPNSGRILKLSTAFTFLTAFQLYAGTSSSQGMTLSLSLKNATVEQAIDRIEQETGYSFLYSNHVLDTNRLISLNASNKDISVVLSQVFDNMGSNTRLWIGKSFCRVRWSPLLSYSNKAVRYRVSYWIRVKNRSLVRMSW